MFAHTLRIATILAVALSTASAFAACNPGTKNCVTAGSGYSFLSKAKQQVFVQPTQGPGVCDPGPAGICESFARVAPTTPAPLVPPQSIAVK
jgi:hypothetical protein